MGSFSSDRTLSTSSYCKEKVSLTTKLAMSLGNLEEGRRQDSPGTGRFFEEVELCRCREASVVYFLETPRSTSHVNSSFLFFFLLQEQAAYIYPIIRSISRLG
jgi:hypothetical protein